MSALVFWLVAGALATVRAGQPASGAAQASESSTDWIENSAYKLRFEGVKRCGTGSLFGFAIRVVPTAGKIFVAPRDVTLKLGGVILDAEQKEMQPEGKQADAKLSSACAPLLPQKDLRAGQTARGFVLFALPQSFLAAPGPMILAYRPTRWGGAPRVEVNVPACLADCPTPPPGPPRKAR